MTDKLVRVPAGARMHDLNDLIAASDVAEICGVTAAAVSNWLHRGRETGWKGSYQIPAPLTHIGGRPVFSRREVIEFRQHYAQELAEDIDKQIAQLNERRRKLENL